MSQITTDEIMTRIVALEGAIAYTATAVSALSHPIKDEIVRCLRDDASLNPPEVAQAINRLADIVDSFKVVS
ncbi:hypothetical protein Xvie_03944 [Xenorhabdus vietnamensis]|uniref:Uncharacterized protein n=1 Tax=Xenorhabdus vietnamensis TaxID=351656 RepID=A0A1Y2S680_9GAMM|nr:hypothetical protein [Xenorhabdus vietnamensis]OTA14166.1 hypothetical protein Xvie_03944 [Xenorhabdus vietnamensis]